MASVPHDGVRARADRSPLRAAALTRELVTPGGLWSQVRVGAATGSTNADVAELAGVGAHEGLVLIAERQRAGRGRLGRSWEVPAGAGLTMSVLLQPRVAGAARIGWLPLLVGVAVVEALAEMPVDAALKGPNDLLVRPAAGAWGKCGGILAEAVAPVAGWADNQPTIIVGIGINVFQVDTELPAAADPRAYPPTSLALAGVRCDRERLAVDVLRGLSDWYVRWTAVAGDPIGSGLGEAYRAHCLTLGRDVTVALPGKRSVRGTATDIDPDGRLVVRTAAGEQHLAAGDVHHVR